VLTALAAVLGFVIDVAAGVLVCLFSLALGLALFFFTRARYREISRITRQIDLVLHGVDSIELSGFEEGELSILQSEITKMVLHIREQNEMLRQDKQLLADSLADIAHQLRTPLTSVNLALALLEKNPDEAEKKASVREIEELLSNMDWLITSLLKLSRLDAGVVGFQSEPVDLAELARSA
jgi:signal transduction histidine kinase